MSGPITHVGLFSGSLDGFTGVDPIRFSAGLWLEEPTTNVCLYPIAGDGSVTGWEGARADLTNPSADRIRVTRNNATSDFRVITEASASPSATAGDVLCVTFEVPASSAGQVLAPRFQWYTGLMGGGSAISTSFPSLAQLPDGRWQATATAPATTGSVRTGFGATGTGVVGEWVEFRLVQIEKKSYPTSHANYTLGPGYGGSLGNPSTRAASSAAISPSGILTPSSGALAFRITPTIETGVEEIWGECGVKGSGTDHVRWGRDSSKHPFVEWSSNDAAYQRLTGSEALNALTAYDLYLGHSATAISLAVDAGTLQTGTRAAASASWGAGNLTLEATKGGVVYRNFATFDRTLTREEISTLNSAAIWTQNIFDGTSAAILRRAR